MANIQQETLSRPPERASVTGRSARHPSGNVCSGPRQLPRRLALAAGIALALGGCADFGGIGAHADLQTASTRDTALTLPDQGGAWPDAAWATRFGGAPLQALVDEAIAGNPNIQIAASRVAAAEAAANLTTAGTLPTVGANFSATRQRYTENGIIPPPLGGAYETDSQLALSFRYDFDFWGRNGAALRSALSQKKLSQAEQQNARLVLATGVARAWLQLGRDSMQLDLVNQQLQVREALDQLTRLRLKAGLDTQSETQASLQQAASLRAEQAQWQEQIALARNQLAALLGRGPDRGLSIPRPVLPAPESVPLPSQLPLSLIGRRPDIVAARWRVEAAQGQIDYAKAAFYPNVDVTAFAGFSALGLSNLLQSSSRVVGAGPAITLPIFEGGALRARLSSQVANYEGAVATYNKSLNDALRDVADQVQSLKSAEAQLGNQEQATQAATRSLALARERRRVGTINQLQLLASQGALLTQQRVAFDVRARRLDLQVGLIKALGGGFDAKQDHLFIPDATAPATAAMTSISTSTSTATATAASSTPAVPAPASSPAAATPIPSNRSAS